MTDQQTEALIQAKGKTAPRITPADILASIASEHYFTAAEAVNRSTMRQISDNEMQLSFERVPEGSPLQLLTICVLVCNNGFTVVGKSACVSRENFDEEIGRKVAREDAKQQLWPLLGYTMKTLGRIVGDYKDAEPKERHYAPLVRE